MAHVFHRYSDAMQLTRRADYALRLLILLGSASEYSSEQRTSVAEAAGALHISWHHLRKIVNQLTHLGYLDSVRGRGGGLRLARSPSEIEIGEVVREMEPNLQPARCASKECPLYPDCRLRAALAAAMDAFLATLDQYTLAQMLEDNATGNSAARLIRQHP